MLSYLPRPVCACIGTSVFYNLKLNFKFFNLFGSKTNPLCVCVCVCVFRFLKLLGESYVFGEVILHHGNEGLFISRGLIGMSMR
jgi:hypothetical protein